MRVTAGRAGTLTLYLDDDSGNLVDADVGHAPTVGVMAGDGSTVIVPAGAATSHGATGTYTYTLAPQTQLDQITVTWSTQVGGQPRTVAQQVNIVGPQRLVDLWALHADPVLAGLSAQQLADIVETVEDQFAVILGYPVVQEGIRRDFMERRYTSNGGTPAWFPGVGFSSSAVADRLLVPGVAYPQQVYALSINGYALTASDLAQIRPDVGILVYEGRLWTSGHYQLWCAHGLDRVPADLRKAAMTCCRYLGRAVPTAGKTHGPLPERVASLTTEGATILFSMPSPNRPTGLPEVDVVLNRYSVDSVL